MVGWARVLVVTLVGCGGQDATVAVSTTGDASSSTNSTSSTSGRTSSSESEGATSSTGSQDETSSEVGSTGPEPIECGDATNGEEIELSADISVDCAVGRTCAVDRDAMALAAFAGPFTVVAEFDLDTRPDVAAPLVSRWDRAGERVFEVGIEPGQQPYLWLSPDGSYAPSSATYARGEVQLRIGAAYEVAVVVEPGVRVAIYLDGQQIREQPDILDALHQGSAELAIGRRAGESDGPLDGAMRRVRLFDRALTGDEVHAIATAHDHCSELQTLPEVVPLTQGPRFHWFGYYDKFQFDPTDRYVLGMSVDFEDRAVKASDVAELGMIDLDADNEWIPLAQSRAFNWQQGCMLQWLPGSNDEIIYNDREDPEGTPHYVARVHNVETGVSRSLSRPIFTVSPDGAIGLGIDFERYKDMVSGYGYPGITDPNAANWAPDDMGIYAIDIASGESQLIITYADTAAFPSDAEGKRFFYAVLVNPAGTRFVFYERIVPAGGGYSHTRVFMADLDGSDLVLVDDAGDASHIDWLDDERVVFYSPHYDGYATIQDGLGHVGNVLDYPVNGHQTFLPGNEWMVSDTYADVFREQHPFLYHLVGDEIYALGHMHSPTEYSGSDRCDNHPRVSRDGRRIVVDSAQSEGRQMYMFDIGELLDQGEARANR